MVDLPRHSFPRQVEVRIKAGVVVHFELPVGLMPRTTGKNVVQQFAEAAAEVPLLVLTDGQFLGNRQHVIGSDIVPFHLLLQVENSQGQNRQAIDDAARCFAVQPHVIPRMHSTLVQCHGKPVVNLFNPVIALLVQPIDVAFDLCDPFVGCVWTACDVFFMPQTKIETKLFRDDPHNTGGVALNRFIVPVNYAIVVKSHDRRYVEHDIPFPGERIPFRGKIERRRILGKVFR